MGKSTIKKLSIDEEADEIIRRLKAPPKKPRRLDDWCFEFTYTFNVTYGLDAEKELEEILSMDIKDIK